MSEPLEPQAPRSGARYTEHQLVEILRRAAERQAGEPAEGDARFSLAEIQQIASEVGITPAHVATAAAELSRRRPAPASGVLGAPTVFRFEEWLDGELPTDAIGELFDIARREFGQQGRISGALDTVEWSGTGRMDSAVVSVTRRQGRTKVGVVLSRSDSAAVVVTGVSLGGILGAMAIGAPLIPAAASVGPLAVAAAVAVSVGWAGTGGWLATRGIWRRVVRSSPGRVDALGAELVEAAQRVLDAARTHTE